MSYGQYFAFQRRPATGITKTDFFDKLESVSQDLVRNGEDVGRLLGRLGRRDHGERVRGLVVQQSGGERRKQRRGQGRGGGGQEDELIKVRARLAARVEHGREKRSRLTRGPPQPRRRDASATAHATVLSPTTAAAFPNHPLMGLSCPDYPRSRRATLPNHRTSLNIFHSFDRSLEDVSVLVRHCVNDSTSQTHYSKSGYVTPQRFDRFRCALRCLIRYLATPLVHG